MEALTSRPYKPAEQTCCDGCVFGGEKHAVWCGHKGIAWIDLNLWSHAVTVEELLVAAIAGGEWKATVTPRPHEHRTKTFLTREEAKQWAEAELKRWRAELRDNSNETAAQ